MHTHTRTSTHAPIQIYIYVICGCIPYLSDVFGTIIISTLLFVKHVIHLFIYLFAVVVVIVIGVVFVLSGCVCARCYCGVVVINQTANPRPHTNHNNKSNQTCCHTVWTMGIHPHGCMARKHTQKAVKRRSYFWILASTHTQADTCTHELDAIYYYVLYAMTSAWSYERYEVYTLCVCVCGD